MARHVAREPLNADQQALVSDHLSLALMMARAQTRRYPRWRDDWESAAFLGLVLAAQRFDQSRGVQFDTYATPRILGAILDAKRGLGPVGWKRIRLQGLPPHVEALDRDVIDRDAEPVGAEMEQRDDLEALIRHLYPREKEAMRLLYGEGLNQNEVGRRLGCVASLVSHRHTCGIATLRAHFVSVRNPS